MLGPEHPKTLVALNNLALIYQHQGRLKEAEKLVVQVLEKQKQVLGPEHPETLNSMVIVAYILKQLGNLGATLFSSGYVQARTTKS